MTSVGRFRGAVLGARVGGACLGGGACLVFGVGVWGSLFQWVYIPLFGFFAFLIELRMP